MAHCGYRDLRNGILRKKPQKATFNDETVEMDRIILQDLELVWYFAVLRLELNHAI
jgi:hypothetical protein